jgi:hypothetical protein
LWRSHNWRRSQELFELGESFISFLRPLEMFADLKQLEEGETFLSEA